MAACLAPISNLASGHKQLFRLAAQHAVERELPLGCPAQFEQQLAAVVGQRVHRVHQAHARRFVQVRAIGHALSEHQHIAVEVRLRHQGDKLLPGRGPAGARRQHQRCSGAVSQLEDAEPLVQQRRGRRRRRRRGLAFFLAVVRLAAGLAGAGGGFRPKARRGLCLPGPISSLPRRRDWPTSSPRMIRMLFGVGDGDRLLRIRRQAPSGWEPLPCRCRWTCRA